MKELFKIESKSYQGLVSGLVDLFFRPWMAMVAWGAFVHMTGFNLPFLSYWQMFMLNIVAVILIKSRPTEWVIKRISKDV